MKKSIVRKEVPCTGTMPVVVINPQLVARTARAESVVDAIERLVETEITNVSDEESNGINIYVRGLISGCEIGIPAKDMMKVISLIKDLMSVFLDEDTDDKGGE